jgi:ubiquinone/menaquinone biosynthesis C-methylase UbiE
MANKPDYIPALRFHRLTNSYDWLMDRLMHDTSTKRRLTRIVRLEETQKVIDVGCGTGTLAILLQQQFPSARIAAADIDPPTLRIAAEKCRKADLNVAFVQCAAQALPFATGSFDYAISCLLFHHLSLVTKRTTLLEIARILRPGGKCVLLDWGKGATPYHRAAFMFVRLLDGFQPTRENARDELPSLIAEAGFSQVREAFNESTPLGTLRCVVAVRT